MEKLLGKIFLTKKTFFGLDTQQILLIVSPSMKVYKVLSSPKNLKNKTPFEENKIILPETIKNWAIENNFNITFEAETPKIKKKLFSEFGDVLVENDDENRPPIGGVNLIITEVEKSKLPQSIKEWAKDNPEKFLQNMERIQKMIKN